MVGRAECTPAHPARAPRNANLDPGSIVAAMTTGVPSCADCRRDARRRCRCRIRLANPDILT
eukprot:428060-Prymnesium_polylepis.1